MTLSKYKRLSSKAPFKLSRRMSVSTFLKRYEDYEGSKVELDDGRPYMMGGASLLHELLVSKIISQFDRYLKGSPCKVYGSNIYLRTKERGIREPDITLICDHSKINGKVYEGIPKLIVEIVSPSSKRMDLYIKKDEYYQLGVKEYWVVLSKDKVQVNTWSEEGYYDEKTFVSKEGILKVPVQLEGWDLVVEIDDKDIPREILE